MTMPRIHILTPYLIPGDAVSNDVFGMVRWFRLRNWHADAYAQYMDASLRGQVQPLAAFERHLNNRGDVLLYHHSVGWDLGLALFGRSRNRKVLRYHSITPARFFRLYNARYSKDCLDGEIQTRKLLHLQPECLLADSPFNTQELIDAGAAAELCRVVPPFHTIGAHERLEEDGELAAELEGLTNLLFVGRVAPNKGHLHLIRAFAYYHHYHDPNSRLILVGRVDPQLTSYLADLRWEIARHDVEDGVSFTGLVSERQLQTYYSRSSVFVCASEHEGFCVPLVEAMHSRLPIVAYASTAVRDTMLDTGLVWETPDPALLAESIDLLRQRPDVRATVVQKQWQRYGEHYSHAAISAAFEEAMAPLLATVEAYA